MKKIIALLSLVLLLLTGCSQYKNVDLNDIKVSKVKMISAQHIELQFKADVENPTRTEFEVTGIEGLLYRNGAEFANLQLIEPATVPANFSGDVLLKCKFSLSDPLAALALGLNIASLNSDDFTADLTVSVKGGALKKNFKYRDMPMSKVFKMFDIKL